MTVFKDGGPPEKPKPGSRAEYDLMDGINWSLLSKMAKSPKHYKWAEDHPIGGDTDAFRLGRVLHMVVLEPPKMKTHIAVWGGPYRRGKAWEAFQGANPGKEIITIEERDRVAGMASALYAHEVACHYLSAPGLTEHSIQWYDRSTKQLCKARLDKVARGRVIEVKTSRNVDPFPFAAAAYRFLYHGQAAYYHDGLLLAQPQELEGNPVILAVESQPPHDVAVYTCSADVMRHGRELRDRLLGLRSECRLTNTWPGVCPGGMELEPPRWAQDDQGDGLDWED